MSASVCRGREGRGRWREGEGGREEERGEYRRQKSTYLSYEELAQALHLNSLKFLSMRYT